MTEDKDKISWDVLHFFVPHPVTMSGGGVAYWSNVSAVMDNVPKNALKIITASKNEARRVIKPEVRDSKTWFSDAKELYKLQDQDNWLGTQLYRYYINYGNWKPDGISVHDETTVLTLTRVVRRK